MDDCSICYEPVSAATGHCTLSCKHSFHIACLTRWSTENPNCPMCRHSLGVTEAPAKQLVEQHVMSLFTDTPTWTWSTTVTTDTPRQTWGTSAAAELLIQSASVDLLRELVRPEPVQPPPPPRPAPNTRIIHIGDGVSVSEADVGIVMEHAHVTRGEAVRALRRYEGCIVNSIMMLIEPREAVPRVVAARDPMQECSDDQATAWFLQELFDDTTYAWNSYSDMIYRMRNNTHKDEYWMHREFQLMETRTKLDAGYESA